MSAGRARRPRCYVAHQIVTYGTDHERVCLAALHRLLPDADLYNPAGRYSTDAGWRRAWPRVLASLSGLVVFADIDGTIGTGCMRELIDAITWGLPVAALAGDELHEIDGIEFVAIERHSAGHAGRLVLAGAVDPTDFLPSWSS